MYPRALLRTSIVILNNIYCLPTYVIWMTLLLPVKRYQPDLYYRIEGLFFHWLLSLVAMWSYTAGYGSKYFLYFALFDVYYIYFFGHFGIKSLKSAMIWRRAARRTFAR